MQSRRSRTGACRLGDASRARASLLLSILATAAVTPASAQVQVGRNREYVYAGGQLLAYQANYADVLPDNAFYGFINTLANLGITGGCGASNYCPDLPVSRETMPTFLLVAKEGTGYQPPPCEPPNFFSDVPHTSPFCPWIEELVRRGVVGGCAAGQYCPQAPVTRAQMAVFLLATAEPGIVPPPCVPPNEFEDVPETSPFCPWIEELKRRGIAGGCQGSPPRYCPGDPVSRGAMAVFLVQTFGLHLPSAE